MMTKSDYDFEISIFLCCGGQGVQLSTSGWSILLIHARW